jgi:hypothetical protein
MYNRSIERKPLIRIARLKLKYGVAERDVYLTDELQQERNASQVRIPPDENQ